MVNSTKGTAARPADVPRDSIKDQKINFTYFWNDWEIINYYSWINHKMLMIVVMKNINYGDLISSQYKICKILRLPEKRYLDSYQKTIFNLVTRAQHIYYALQFGKPQKLREHAQSLCNFKRGRSEELKAQSKPLAQAFGRFEKEITDGDFLCRISCCQDLMAHLVCECVNSLLTPANTLHAKNCNGFLFFDQKKNYKRDVDGHNFYYHLHLVKAFRNVLAHPCQYVKGRVCSREECWNSIRTIIHTFIGPEIDVVCVHALRLDFNN